MFIRYLSIIVFLVFGFADAKNKIFLAVDISGSFYKLIPDALRGMADKKILANEIKNKRDISLRLVRIDDDTNLDDVLIVTEFERFNSYLQEVKRAKEFVKYAEKIFSTSNPSNRTDFLGFFNVVSQQVDPADNLTLIILSDGRHNTQFKFDLRRFRLINGFKRIIFITDSAQYLSDIWKKPLNDAGFNIEIYTIEVLQLNKGVP